MQQIILGATGQAVLEVRVPQPLVSAAQSQCPTLPSGGARPDTELKNSGVFHSVLQSFWILASTASNSNPLM